ncbi:hypothetical protein CMU21_14745 [Elizabethkingia anophelis]|nr:hypothetical protein [Elizabethkingia anophelis]
MEAKELRIGNYLHDRNGNLCKVIELREDGIYAPAIGKATTGLPNKPIELTEEWLLKFGFEIEKSSSHCIAFNESYDHELQLDKEFGKTENCWNITKYGGGYRLIYYVHQLQNLYFALTGEELTIKS